jgi:hypothetical protein
MKWQVGNNKQILISLIFIGVVGLSTISPHISNVHLAITILFGGLHVYMGHQWEKGKLKSKEVVPASYAYITAYIINTIVSIAYGWWFSGIVWLMILVIYIAVQNDPPKKKEA